MGLFTSAIIFLVSTLFRLSARNAGCFTPIAYRHKDFVLGLDLFMKRIESMKLGNSLALDKYLFDTYGKTVQTNFWGKKQYVTKDPLNIQTVCATYVDRFGSAPKNNAIGRPLLGDGIMTTDGAQWKRSRQILNPVFARAQISELSTFELHVGQMLSKIPIDSTIVDLQPLLKMLFLDSNTEFIFGKSANSLAPGTSSLFDRRLPEVFDEALRGTRKRMIMGKLRFLSGGNKEYLAKCAEVEEPEGSPYNYVLLKALTRITDDRKFIRNELMNVFFPARDTSAILTGNIIFLLARHPNVWNTLREEVISIGNQKLTFELLKSMKYMHGVISEGLRLLNPVSRSWKTCLEPCVLPHGGGSDGSEQILLQPGDEVDMVFSSMHVDPDIWGDDAGEFRPERWSGLKHSWNFIPFFGGRRIYPAQQNVLTDVSYVLVRLLQQFVTCENFDQCMEYVEEFGFTKESRNEIKVALTRA
ncbi:cytochrome P450 alkane hydroxylase-like protein [Amylocarpus encephaloides]|uniref:Cytochrome P450 alkane hydroxylase-like protein n=1 Tax=Amylocarpus encephaloides TaxID=45428 RepID=A0A9P7YBB4_9HELO|nr:cytochrome P450 alkane hydroxylase-like protein [Amylocarpus encephaloides]